MRTLLATAVAALFTAWPRIALACAVCFDATAENRTAYLVTTIFLSFLPLGLIGGGVFYLYRRVRAAEPPRRPLPTD